MDGIRKGIALEKFRNIKQQTWMSVVVDLARVAIRCCKTTLCLEGRELGLGRLFFFFYRKCQCLHSFVPPTVEEFQIWSIDLFFVKMPDNLKTSTDFVIYSRYKRVFLLFVYFECLKFKLERQQQGFQISQL